MSQPVNGSNIEEPPMEDSSVVLSVRLLGYCLSFIGWLYFAFSLLMVIVMADAHVSDRTLFDQDARHAFLICSYWIVPGWLLQRLADGLFPFSRKFYKTLKEPLA